MNTSKFLIAGLTIATLAAAPVLLARDTEAQIKAREALQQKMNELNAQPDTASPAAKPKSAKPAPAPAVVPKPASAKPVAQPTPVLAEPAPAPAAKPASVAAPVKPVAQPTPAPAPVPAPAPKPVVAKQTQSSKAEFSEVPGPSSLGNIRIGQATAAPTAPAQPGTPVVVNPAPPTQASSTQPVFSEPPPASPGHPEPPNVVTTSSAKAPGAGGYQPLAAPASPLSASKEAQLADLLSKYRADLITPAQYHQERAKIMGAP